jgi:hypothetical protein
MFSAYLSACLSCGVVNCERVVRAESMLVRCKRGCRFVLERVQNLGANQIFTTSCLRPSVFHCDISDRVVMGECVIDHTIRR